MQQLCQELTSTAPSERIRALKQLGGMGPAAAPAVPAILACLNANGGFAASIAWTTHPSPTVADAAIEALGKVGNAARDASPQLVAMLSDRNQLFRRSIILNTLEKVGVDNAATPTLMDVVRQEGKFTESRLCAIRLLGEAQPPSLDALDLLKEIAADKTDATARQAALQATRSILEKSHNTSEQAQQWENQLAGLKLAIAPGQPPPARLEALEKIAKLGPQAAPLWQQLLPLLDEPETAVQAGAVNAFCSIGPRASGALSGLVSRFFAAKDEFARDQLTRAIVVIDPSGKLSISFIEPALNDPFRARIALGLLDQMGSNECHALADNARQRWCLK